MKRVAVLVLATIAAFVLGILVGIVGAGRNVVWGKVDLLAGHPDKVVSLLRPLEFQSASGKRATLEAGAQLHWEGTYNDENYFSIRYVLVGESDFEVEPSPLSGKSVYYELSNGADVDD